MSLICDETKKCIPFGEPLKAGTRSDVNFYSALSKEIIDKIPESERLANPRNPKFGGLDIFIASSSLNFPTENYTLGNFTLNDFYFSISQETAEKYLPNHLNRYPKFVMSNDNSTKNMHSH